MYYFGSCFFTEEHKALLLTFYNYKHLSTREIFSNQIIYWPEKSSAKQVVCLFCCFFFFYNETHMTQLFLIKLTREKKKRKSILTQSGQNNSDSMFFDISTCFQGFKAFLSMS